MVYRKLILVFIFLAVFGSASAQETSYAEADSITYAQYLSGNWKALKVTGKQALHQGVDFPYLRLRIAYANFMTGNYSAALKQYHHILKKDSFNETAHLYSYLCNEYLNRYDEAAFQASKLSDSILIKSKIKRSGLLKAGFETSYKIPDDVLRNPGTYFRLHISNRLFLRLKFEQSISFYNQQLTTTPNFNSGKRNTALNNNQQIEYYGKLSYPISKSLTLLGGYHYLNNTFGKTIYHNQVVLGGLKFATPFYDLQADVNLSRFALINVNQYNAGFTIYPKGNLNLYAISRISFQNQNAANQLMFSQIAGSKIAKFLWLEGNVTVGKLNNYVDADALYVYNSIDPSLFKTGATAYIPMRSKVLLNLNYTYEQKENVFELYNYNQHSISGGLTWKF